MTISGARRPEPASQIRAGAAASSAGASSIGSAGVFDQPHLRRPLAATDLDPAVLEGAEIDAGALGQAGSR
jgi:hypothetical protein